MGSCFADALTDLLQAKLVVARAQALARQADVDCIGTKVIVGAHLVERACKHKQFGNFEGGHGAAISVVGAGAPGIRIERVAPAPLGLNLSKAGARLRQAQPERFGGRTG